ncbi:MAG: alpha/beta fold hydrolase [Candidatus Eremiobacteraeota bacterium]|nr:alpha/beta fold hydrolase [Candidatus Eremiobacteraeota bacterium]
MIAPPPSVPAESYEQARARARAFLDLDGNDVLPAACSAFFDHGRRTPLAVLLLHGYTNNPAQYSEFAPLVFERGANVFVPRMPKHGERNRLTDRIASLRAEELVQCASDALDVTLGLGDRVGVLGISMGAGLAAFVAQYRTVAIAVPVAPDFALLDLSYPVSHFAGRVLAALPNFFIWWDPRERGHHRPLTAYPRFSTRALAQTLRIGDEVYAAVRRQPQCAQRIVTIVNRNDPAVNNEVTQQVHLHWSGWNSAGAEYVELRGLPENHDIIDPQNPFARTAQVYPRLLKALGVGE